MTKNNVGKIIIIFFLIIQKFLENYKNIKTINMTKK